jgi:hypothetical protein
LELHAEAQRYLPLYKHGNQWLVRVKVPDRLRPILGVSKLVVPLHTDSVAIANRDKHQHIHALKQRIADAEAELRRRNRKPADPLVEEALIWRASLKHEEATAEEGEMTNADAPSDPTGRRNGRSCEACDCRGRAARG